MPAITPIRISPMFSRSGGAAPVAIGTIINNDFSSGSWTYFGTGSAAFNPSNITLSGGDSPFPGAYTLGLKSNLVTSCENSQFIIYVEMSADSRCGNGFLGSVQGSAYSMMLTAAGQFINFLDDTFANNSFPTLLTWSAGDVLRFTINRSYNQIQAIVENITVTGSITLNHNITNVYGDPSTDRAYSGATQLYINNWGGTNKITSIQYSSTDWKFADLIFIGTSKTAGFYAGTKAARFSDLYTLGTGKKCNNWATSSGTTAVYLNQVDEIITMQPKAVYIEGPCNDVRISVPELTIEANMNSLISQLQAGISGVIIYIQLCFPELSGQDFTTLNTFLSTLASTNVIVIPVPPTFNTATMLVADNVHLNALGNTTNSNYLQTQIP